MTEIFVYLVIAIAVAFFARGLGRLFLFKSVFGIFPPPRWFGNARDKVEKTVNRELQNKAAAIKSKYTVYAVWSILFQQKLPGEIFKSRMGHIIENDEDFVQKFSEFYAAYKIAAKAGFAVKKVPEEYFGFPDHLFT